MALQPGTRLGAYEVLGLLGAGGMGEVYKARDTRLDRTVALKVLPTHLSTDVERRARFEREARTIAQLAHPHICTLHDIGEADGVSYLVMEYLAGETLAARIVRGPLPIPQALEIAAQTSDALAAAHRQGIVHRDLKPANVMLVRAESRTGGAGASPGTAPAPGSGPAALPFVKLLDFGLAKLSAHGDAPAVAMTTASMPAAASLTERGAILGTLPYMAPEQVQGLDVDGRTDLWALGAILYEMLTGRRAFEGENSASLVGNILHTEPPALSARQRLTPPALERLVRKCLAKEPDGRWESAHDVADELRWIAQPRAAEGGAVPVLSRRRRLGAALIAAATLGVALIVATAVWLMRKPSPSSLTLTRLTFDPGLQRDPTFSPDGRSIAYASNKAGNFDIWMQPLDGGTAVQLTNDPADDWQADWSSDGRSIAFRSEREGGGVFALSLADRHVHRILDHGYQPRWSPDGLRLLFSSDRTFGISSLTRADGSDEKALPLPSGPQLAWHPDGQRLVRLVGGVGKLRMISVDVDRQQVVEHAVSPEVQHRFDEARLSVGPGAWSRDGTTLYFTGVAGWVFDLWKVTVDRSLEVTGGPDRLTAGGDSETGVAASPDGRLAFSVSPPNTRVWSYDLDRGGHAVMSTAKPLTGLELNAFDPALSPDGRHLAVQVDHPGSRHTHELREISLVDGRIRSLRLVDIEANEQITGIRWSPDQTRLSYFYFNQGQQSVRILDLASGEEHRLTANWSAPKFPGEIPFGWSIDGKAILTTGSRYQQGMSAVALLPLSAAPTAEREARVLASSKDLYLWQATMSPNGRWICVNGTPPDFGSSALYIVPATGGEVRRLTAERAVADKPRWAADGRLIYYTLSAGTSISVWALPFDPESGQATGAPFQVTQFGAAGVSLPTEGGFEISVSGHHLLVPLQTLSGGIWMLQ